MNPSRILSRVLLALTLTGVLLTPTAASGLTESRDPVARGTTTAKLFTKAFTFRSNVWLERNGVYRCVRFAYRAKVRVRVKYVKTDSIIGYYYRWENPRVVDPKIRMTLYKGNAARLTHNKWCPIKDKPRGGAKGAFMKASLWGSGSVCRMNPSIGASYPAGVSVGFTPECGKSTKYWRIHKSANDWSTAFSLFKTGRYGLWSYGSTFYRPDTKVCLKARFYGQVNRPRTDAHSAGFTRKRTVCLPVGRWADTLSPY